MLAGNGGKVTLTELTEDGYAILQFGGGCNGCSMVDYLSLIHISEPTRPY